MALTRFPNNPARPAMKSRLSIDMAGQPDDVSCGPTCLQALYRYYGNDLPINQLIDEVRMLDEGGTMAVFLANHALRNGYRATIYTYNLQLFDPSWFKGDTDIAERLQKQARHKRARRLQIATKGYLEFLRLGGEVRFREMNARLIRDYLRRGIPMLTGLSSTYLYDAMREVPDTNADDDLRGEPAGHFVILSGYDPETRHVRIADPWPEHPYEPAHDYEVTISRLVGAILLGVVTYDANLLVIEPNDEVLKTRDKA